MVYRTKLLMVTKDDFGAQRSGNTPTSRSVVVKKRPSKPIQLIVTQSPSSSATSIIIPMRSIRFGSYEVPSFKPDVIFTEESVILTVTIDGRDITFTINGEDMTRFEIHTKTPAALMNIITTPRVGNLIRDRCNMKHKSMGWFDPGSMVESEKRILMIAFKDPLDLYTFATLSKIFRNIGISNNIDGFFVQLTKDESNDLLVLCRDHSSAIKSQKTNTTLQTTRYQSFEASDAVELDDHSVFSERIVKLCSYPPPPCTGAITITNEDLFCLREGEFLNDVIIDFYLKYLTLNVLSEADRKRTYMFSSFFYKRLTQRVKRIVDSSVTMTLEQRRHERVKTWTRHVDIFEKDFIIVPINESAHWFLAFICFPSKATVPNDDADDDDDNKSSSGNVESSGDNADQKSENPQLSVFLQSDKPDDCSDMESMDSSSQNGDKSMMESDNSNAESDKFNLKQENMDAGDNTAEDTDEKTDSTTPNSWKQYQRPCVLVMDSLMGASRNHTVRQLKDYLVVEWENRKGKSRVFKRENIRGSVVKVPQQNNFSDCGVFLLHYVEMFFKKPLQSFSLPISTLKEWFDGEEIPEKRKFIAKLITQLQTDQKTAKKTI
ncbi:sentrin-specific protease 6-like [Saccoglossus kowalevskii]